MDASYTEPAGWMRRTLSLLCVVQVRFNVIKVTPAAGGAGKGFGKF